MSSPLTKIPLIQRCIFFTPDLSISQALQLAFVSSAFAETIIDFHYTLETIISHHQHNNSNTQTEEECKQQRLLVENALYKIVKSSCQHEGLSKWIPELLLKVFSHSDQDWIREFQTLFLRHQDFIPIVTANGTTDQNRVLTSPLEIIFYNNRIDILRIMFQYIDKKYLLELLPDRSNLHKPATYYYWSDGCNNDKNKNNAEIIRVFCELLEDLDLLKTELSQKTMNHVQNSKNHNFFIPVSGPPTIAALTTIKTLPLSVAIKEKNLPAVKVLFEYLKKYDLLEEQMQSDMGIMSGDDQTVLEIACSTEDVEIVNFIFSYYEELIEEKDKQGEDENNIGSGKKNLWAAHQIPLAQLDIRKCFQQLLRWADGDLLSRFFSTIVNHSEDFRDNTSDKKRSLLEDSTNLAIPPQSTLHGRRYTRNRETVLPLHTLVKTNRHLSSFKFLVGEFRKLSTTPHVSSLLLRQNLRSSVLIHNFNPLSRTAENDNILTSLCKYVKDPEYFEHVLNLLFEKGNVLSDLINCTFAFFKPSSSTSTSSSVRNTQMSVQTPLCCLCFENRSSPKLLEIFLHYCCSEAKCGFPLKDILSEEGLYFKTPLIFASQFKISSLFHQSTKSNNDNNAAATGNGSRLNDEEEQQLQFLKLLLEKLEEAGILQEQLKKRAQGDGSTALSIASPNINVQKLLLAKCGSETLCKELIFEQKTIDYYSKDVEERNLIEYCERQGYFENVEFFQDENVWEECKQWYEEKFCDKL